MIQIIISHVYPPIPLQQFDWSAHEEGTEDKIGYGSTIQEAIDSFLENFPETEYKWK